MGIRIYPIVVRPNYRGQGFVAHCNGQTAEHERPAHAALDLAQRLYPHTDHIVRRITPVVYSLEVHIQDAPCTHTPALPVQTAEVSHP